jgi:outer membrane protein insertion porin family
LLRADRRSIDRPRARARIASCHTRRVRFALVSLAIVLATTTAAAETIKEIVVEDNKKTDSDTVILISKLDVGDDWTNDLIPQVKANLVSSGLFKDVTVFSEPHRDGGVRVHLLVKDKHSWVIAPAFYTQPTNIGGGVGFGENNLFGKNQKLLIYGQIATGDSFFIGAWVIPNLGGTRFYTQLDTYLKSSRNIEYASPTEYLDTNPVAIRESRINYLNAGIKLGVELFRGVKIDTRLRAARVSYPSKSLEYLREGGDAAQQAADLGTNVGDPIPKPGKEGADISNEWTLSIDRRANWYGIQSGYLYKAWFEQGTPSLGSDFDYSLFGGSLFRATRLLERHNFVVKASVAYGRHLPFQQEFAMGGTSMRGYLNNQFRGDFKAQGNLEYSFPFITISGLSVRGLLFVDSGYTTFITARETDPQRDYLPGSAHRGLNGFKNSVGIGTRLYLRQIVLPLLGLDVGYGLEARDVQVYLAIGLTD